jgi:energy-coupling factor transporter ATP-binding protein EcfA2
VLLDVPTSGLDRSGFLRTLRAIQRFRARGKTLVIASHDVVFLRECASTVLMLQEGTVAAEGNAATVLTDREKLVRMGYGGLSVPGASPWDPAPQSSLSIRRSLPQP